MQSESCFSIQIVVRETREPAGFPCLFGLCSFLVERNSPDLPWPISLDYAAVRDHAVCLLEPMDSFTYCIPPHTVFI